MKTITIPRKLAPLVKAFSEDDQSARLLIIEAAKAINKTEKRIGYGCDEEKISNEELEGIIALMKGIAPRDTIEMIYGAQIISSHLMGLRLLGSNHANDQVLGLRLLRFSNDALSQLQKKKAGGISKNINITYNHAGPGPALMQTVIPKDNLCQ